MPNVQVVVNSALTIAAFSLVVEVTLLMVPLFIYFFTKFGNFCSL